MIASIHGDWKPAILACYTIAALLSAVMLTSCVRDTRYPFRSGTRKTALITRGSGGDFVRSLTDAIQSGTIVKAKTTVEEMQAIFSGQRYHLDRERGPLEMTLAIYAGSDYRTCAGTRYAGGYSSAPYPFYPRWIMTATFDRKRVLADLTLRFMESREYLENGVLVQQ